MNSRLSLADLRKQKMINQANESIQFMTYALESYSNFKEFIRLLLDSAVKNLEENANKVGFDLSEDQLTIYLLGIINNPFLGVLACHEVNQRGHCDITIKLDNYTWHGEAKKHSSAYSYLFKGYTQLTERYSTGTVDSASGGVIIYTKNRLCHDVMKSYVSYVEKGAPKIHASKTISISACPNNPLVYYSTHEHTLTKLSYEVIHYPVNLYHNPQD
ncbi:hypothetical protein EH227_04740 [Rouxiella chamberiensis]|nr:hypothetical protein EH227_04740 [Rouxiella chamberiensis]